MEMFEISDDRFRPEVAEIGQNFFFIENNPKSVSDNNMDPWKRFLTEKAALTWQPMNVLFKFTKWKNTFLKRFSSLWNEEKPWIKVSFQNEEEHKIKKNGFTFL